MYKDIEACLSGKIDSSVLSRLSDDPQKLKREVQADRIRKRQLQRNRGQASSRQCTQKRIEKEIRKTKEREGRSYGLYYRK